MEGLIVGAAVEMILRAHPRVTLDNCPDRQHLALEVITYGMVKAGYRYRKGLLDSDDFRILGLAAIEKLKQSQKGSPT